MSASHLFDEDQRTFYLDLSRANFVQFGGPAAGVARRASRFLAEVGADRGRLT